MLTAISSMRLEIGSLNLDRVQPEQHMSMTRIVFVYDVLVYEINSCLGSATSIDYIHYMKYTELNPTESNQLNESTIQCNEFRLG